MPNAQTTRPRTTSFTRLNLRSVAMTALPTLILIGLSVYTFAMLRQGGDDGGAVCRSNLKQYALGVLMYVQDYDERFPPMKLPAQVENRIYPYVKNRAIYSCPVTMTEYLPNPALNYREDSSVDAPASMMMLRDAKAHTPTSGKPYWDVAFADGHVKAVTSEPMLGKLWPTPPKTTRTQDIVAELKALRAQRSAVDKQILQLEKELRKRQKR